MSETVYLRPKQLDAALAALSQWRESARVLAGGTDLLVKMRSGTLTPEAIVDVGAIEELRVIRKERDHIFVGARTTHAEIEESPLLAAFACALTLACREIGSAQIRNRGTLGGNLVNASPAGDAIPALSVLDAEIGLARSGGERWVSVHDFFTGPGQTVRRSDELIVGVRFPPMEQGECSFFQKIGQRRAVRIAKATACGRLMLQDGIVQSCAIALGAVAPTVIRCPRCESFLIGRRLDTPTIAEAGSLASESCQPITDIRSTADYRCHIVRILAQRGLSTIADGRGI
jgi:CO/xanthine dehydrogenase FAD-binding subunit